MATPTELREIADAKFKKKELQRLDGYAAMAEYEAASRATIEKTARLRALRLSRDVAPQPLPAASASQARRPSKARASRVSKASSAT